MKFSKSITWLILDIGLICIVYCISFLIRFEGALALEGYRIFGSTVIFPVLIYSLIFLVFGVYSRLWRYLSLLDVAYILFSIFCGTAIFMLMTPLLVKAYSFPRSVVVINAAMLSLAILISRFIERFIREEIIEIFSRGRKNILILGAGDAGALLLQDIKKTASDKYKVLGFLDDDTKKIGRVINGVKVISTIDNLSTIVKKRHIEEVFIAMPSATREQIDRIFSVAKTAEVESRIIPSTREILDSNKVYATQLKEIDLNDLLGREPAIVDLDIIRQGLENKKVVVSGAGGSIGYEICCQTLNFKPAAIMLLERDEMRLFHAMNKLKEKYPDANCIQPVIADVADQIICRRILSEFRPDIVFHAAAYKHVPLGEDNPVSYVVNNIFGTVNFVEECNRAGVGKFVFVSTDKAVEPVNITGVTKRICEEFIRSFSIQSKTSFVIVRFGNVLGSSGSVIEIFEEQIRSKKPLTVTSKDATRFFMTTEEAVTLSLEAASIGKTAEIYVLDMGKPIKLVDIAKDVLFLSQKNDSVENQIIVTGLRKGDKIEEKLYEDKEIAVNTKYDKLLLVKKDQEGIDYCKFLNWLKQLKVMTENYRPDVKKEIEKMFKEIVSDYLTYSEYADVKRLL